MGRMSQASGTARRHAVRWEACGLRITVIEAVAA